MSVSPISREHIAQLQEVSTEAAIASARIVLAGQRGDLALHTTLKTDQSVLTDADRKSEAVAKKVWRACTPYPILGEETGISSGTVGETRIMGMNDPIDGTRPFVNGAHSSTVMAGAYDLADKRFITSSLIHPTSGTLVESSNGRTRVGRVDIDGDDTGVMDTYEGAVWNGPLCGSTVLVDNFAPFERGTGEGETRRVITDAPRLGRFLTGLLETGAVPQGYGSNGYHQMLMAKGGEKLAGAVMLAQGGPWDALGLLSVENSGGSARAFAVEQYGRLDERDPHDPSNWDILVLGNVPQTTDALASVVEQMYVA